MGLTMKKILNRFDDCNKFCLTGGVSKYNFTISEEEYNNSTKNMNYNEIENFSNQFLEKYNITEEEFTKALNNIKNKDKENLRHLYNANKEKLKDYPDFDTIYNEIEKECYEFNNEKNREYYFNKFYDDEEIEKLKKEGLTEEEFAKMKKDCFRYGYITSQYGKIIKYGKENYNLFYQFYDRISHNIDRETTKNEYCNTFGKSPLEQIPTELKEHFLYYEISFYNEVTISGGLMINYYFKLNEETKKYLLKFRNDFLLNGLEDLTLYKNDEVKFYSCTHENFNSIELDYKNMSKEEIIDFINDEYPDEDNTKIINTVYEIINMDESRKFSFKEIGIEDQNLMCMICDICSMIGFNLTSKKYDKNELNTIKKDGNYRAVAELPAILCDIDEIVGKETII